MLKTIIKRDGSTEEFTPSKLNRWADWAGKELGDKVDWSTVVLHTVSNVPETFSSQDLQLRLIKTCLDMDTWSYNLMAGRLYAAYLHKKILGESFPTVKDVQTKLINAGIMKPIGYTDDEYVLINDMIDHTRDFNCPHFGLHSVRAKYALKNRKENIEYETQQFVFMRMAMALSVYEKPEEKLTYVKDYYEEFSKNRLSAPTPNYVNLGTYLNGYASCCLYKADDNAESLAIGDHIAYIMTCQSAGIGGIINTRSIGDSVRNGVIKHQGKLPYYRALDGAIHANLQNGRGGAATTYYSAFDPEVEAIGKLKNPMTPADKQIRGLDYCLINNKFFARKVARKEKMFTFNCQTAPDLFESLFSSDVSLFETLYKKYEADENFIKKYVDARDVVLNALNEAHEAGRHYLAWADEINKHTPFLDPIYTSNLCTEAILPTQAYFSMKDLYSTEDHGRGEVALCSLGAVVISNIHSKEQYRKTMFLGLRMIDRCIHMSEYVLPHVGVTAKARMNAGMGIMDLAHLLAREGLTYTSSEGKKRIHEIAEWHMYCAIEQSLELGKEFGNAPWMHKTKWPLGWMPIDTYNKNVDTLEKFENKCDWEDLRARVVANGGIRNSALVNYMPGESSSKAMGLVNAIYPAREATLIKTDNSVTTYWAAPNSDDPAYNYEWAWDIPSEDMVAVYSIFQKFTDQGISADLWVKVIDDQKISSDDMLSTYLMMTKYGMKTRYYQNVLTTEGVSIDYDDNRGCGSGSCTL